MVIQNQNVTYIYLGYMKNIQSSDTEVIKQIGELSADAITLHGPDGQYLYASPSSYEIKGFLPEDLLGTSPFDRVHKDDLSGLQELFQSSLTSKTNQTYRYRFLHPNGTYRWLESSAVPLVKNDILNQILIISRNVNEQVEKEQTLLHSETTLKQLAENISDYITIIDKDGIIEFANYGTEGETNEFIGKQYFSLIPDSERSKVSSFLKLTLKNSRTYNYDCRAVDSNGDELWFSCTISPIKRKGAPRKAVITSKSIGDIPTGNSELREKEERFRNLVEAAHDFIYRCDYQGFFTYSNPAAIDIFGELGKTPGREHFGNIVREDYVGHVATFYQEQFKQRIDTTYLEFPAKSKNGKTVWIGQNVQMLLEGDWIIGFQAVARDITEQVLMEEAVRDSESRLSALLNSIPDMMFRVGIDGTILDFQPGTYKPFFTKDEIIGKNISATTLSSNAKKKLLKGIELAIETDRAQVVQYQFLTTNKQQITYDARIVRINEKEVMSTIRNMSAQKKVEVELRDARKNAEESSRAKEQFLSIMSHEIRTPLNAIVGLTNLLKEQTSSGEQLEFINGIKYSSDNLLKLVNDILDFQKIESKKLILESTAFVLEDLIKSVIQTSKAGFQESNIEVNYQIAEDIPNTLNGDPVRLNQILINLIGNALKFTKLGQIQIEVIKISQPDGYIELEFAVKDSGIGIQQDRLSQIFDSFTQANADTTRKYGGTGLGLTITKQLVELQGGKIQVESTPNEGSTFTFTITFEISSTKKQHVAALKQSLDSEALKEFRVLVAEDNEMNQLVMSKYLDRWGIYYEMAENGIEAINKVRYEDFDLILLDLEMPKMNGYEAASFIRQELTGAKQNIPIIAISAYTLASIKRKAKQAGINDFVTKPVDYHVLEAKLIKYLGEKIAKKSRPDKGASQHQGIRYSLINLSYLKESSLNDEDYIVKMINMFLKNTPSYIKSIKSLYKDEKLVELQILAHKFKASINIMGIHSVGRLINKLEENISKNKNIDELSTLISGIEIYSLASCAELEVLLRSGQFPSFK